MHIRDLAFEAPLLCAMTALAAACLYFYVWRIGVRPWYSLVAVVGWLSWSLYFSLLAITAGPAPKLNRGEITPVVRWAELAGGLLLAVWLAMWIRDGIGRHRWYSWYVADDGPNDATDENGHSGDAEQAR